jgi:hypothetical protein
VGIFKNHRTCRHNAAAFDHGMVHHHRAHPNQDFVLNRATMDNGPVTDTHPRSHGCGSPLIGAMDDCPILNIGLIPDADGIDIAPQHGIVPNRARITQD